MRWLSRLLVVIAVCLVAIALPDAHAQANGANIWLSSNSRVPGEVITVYGQNFTPDEWVDIYYYRDTIHDIWVAEVQAESDGGFDVDFEVPESYAGVHNVRADQGDTSVTADFNVKPGLKISPEDGPVGTPVIVEGHGFAKNEDGIELRYYLNGDYEVIAENIEADDDGWWERSFPIPPSTKGDHKLDARGDTSSLPQVKDALFEITPGISINKSSGSPGNNITMMGIGFADNERDISILFAGEEVATEIRADETGYWEEDFQVPEMPKGTYDVTAEGEQTLEEDINELSFQIEPGLVLSPDKGHVGMNLTVAGYGFATDEDVDVMYDGIQVETAETNDKGSFDVSFPVPESKYGARQVKAEDAAENEATTIFTMESDPPPIPELISPPDGSRVGFIGRVRPTFEWSAVSDVSGVYYSLQIATSANVTATGEFVDPIVSKEGLVGTNYTLQGTEALPNGTCYWIVQAVDGAENGSGWTAARSFHAGLLPLWAFIVIIVAIVGAIGAAVYFFIIRRRIYYY
jgi:hypothetical protein